METASLEEKIGCLAELLVNTTLSDPKFQISALIKRGFNQAAYTSIGAALGAYGFYFVNGPLYNGDVYVNPQIANFFVYTGAICSGIVAAILCNHNNERNENEILRALWSQAEDKAREIILSKQ